MAVRELYLQPEIFAPFWMNDADLSLDLGRFFVVRDVESERTQCRDQFVIEFFNSHGFAPSLVIGGLGQSSRPLFWCEFSSDQARDDLAFRLLGRFQRFQLV